MLGRVVLAALLAGIVAGLLMGVIQHVRLTPMILEAETYEAAVLGAGHSHDAHAAAAASTTVTDWWRTAQTFAATAVAGAGFAAMLAGFSILAGIPITRANGMAWGLAGFATISLAPAAGLPPELPGVPAGELVARQAWWATTVLCTAGGLWLMSQTRQLGAILAALAIIAVPHIVGAPQPPDHETAVPATLLARFVASSLAANGLFWLAIGTFLGIAMQFADKQRET